MDTQDIKTVSPKYWMSLEQWRQDPEFLKFAEQEFLSSPLQSEDGKDGWARREFLKLMGASLALSTFGCVRRPAQKIIPYVKKPMDIVHGIPNHYASSFVDGLEGLGILVTTRDGRPIKIEGNDEHPLNRGGMSARAHAHILRLYDPDRFTGPKHNLQNDQRSNRETINAKWEELDAAVVEQLKKGGVGLLMATHYSPSTQAVVDDFTSAFNAENYHYDDGSFSAFLKAQKLSYGQAAVPRYHFDRAKMVVAINNDFLGTWLSPVVFQKDFMARRKNTTDMNRLVVFESLMSLTGSNADQRVRIRPSQTLDIVMALVHELIAVQKLSRFAGNESLTRLAAGFAKSAAEFAPQIKEAAKELAQYRGQSIVVAGGPSGDTADAVAIAVATNLLNAILENDGKTIESSGRVVNKSGQGIDDLIRDLNAKKISTLIIHGANPVYSLPDAAKFVDAAKNAKLIIYTGDRNDETARVSDYVATDHHPLENWGDMQAFDGTLSIQQPTIEPLYETRAFQDSLLTWVKSAGKGSARAKASENWYGYLRANWTENLSKGRTNGKSFEEFWVDFLQVGALKGSESGDSRNFSQSAVSAISKQSNLVDGYELALYETVGLGNGQLANVSWLQELPDPITKLVWDNYACMSLADAKKLKVKEGQFVSLKAGSQTLEVPVHVQPGVADGVIGLALGYGRKGAGQVADGVGVRAVQLAQFANGHAVTAGLATEVRPLSKCVTLSGTQGHHTMEGRQIVVEETRDEHVKNPGGRVHRHHMTTMWSEHKYNGNKWGMVIDLSSCTGCSACVIACQSENNIPTVGRAYVADGREMHWIRIDRYYVGTPEDPDVVHQPLPCMHCDNAPCETVCPVVATSHSDEGTNDMTYNRCVGTRYCANNCPYKVRRFNWFDYTEIAAPKHLALNPEVTVRHRGVMEKCSFCIHRIRFQKSQAKLNDRKLKDGDVQTACQQSCPTGAIIFGDLNDPNSAVAKEFKSPKAYSLLEELNAKPMVRYQVKVRNTEQLKGEDQHHGNGHANEGHHV